MPDGTRTFNARRRLLGNTRSVFLNGLSSFAAFGRQQLEKATSNVVIEVLNCYSATSNHATFLNYYLEQRDAMIIVFWRTSSWFWVFEVEINSVKDTGSREFSGGIAERRPVFGCWQHDCHLPHAEIPSPDGDWHLEILLLFFQVNCLFITKSKSFRVNCCCSSVNNVKKFFRTLACFYVCMWVCACMSVYACRSLFV